MSKTNLGLVSHCEMALKEGWYYLWGSYAQFATKDVIDRNIKQYPTNETWRTYASKAIGKTRVCDCYGLVKSYLWWVDSKNNPKYNAAHDTNTSSAYSKAKERGSLASLPEIPGIILYMSGHVGVYIGNGRFIECAGGGVGMSEGKIVNGKVTKGSKFTHWFKDANIEYVDPADQTEEEIEMVEKIKVKIDDKVCDMDSILKDGFNYIKIQDFKNAGFTVEYDKVNKMPVLYTPKK